MNILITGGNGYIANAIYHFLNPKYKVTRISRSDFDLSNREDTNSFFKGKHFDIVIHTAIKGGSRLEDDSLDITHHNLSMFYNLLNNKSHFDRFINLGSGAEMGYPTSPYGMSKSIISKFIEGLPYFYNIRIFGIFDENELNTRFIKANIKKYLNKEPLIIHQNKEMDFFYMEDFLSIIQYYVKSNYKNTFLPKIMNCSYDKKYTLLDIAEYINNLGDHKCNIELQNPSLGTSYIGESTMWYMDYTKIPFINFLGLEKGIEKVYLKLLHEY